MTKKKCPYCFEDIASEAVFCKHCRTDLDSKAPSPAPKKRSLLSKVITGACVFFFGIAMLSFALDQQSATRSAEVTEKAKQQAIAMQEYVTQNEPIDSRFVFDGTLHAKTIDVNLVEPAPAVDLLASGITFSSKSASDDYASIERVDTVASDEEVLVYQEVDGDETWSDYRFALIKFTNVEGEETVGWIDTKYLLPKDEYAVASTEYDNSPEGKICNKHPEWSYSDCTKVAADMIWIGMSIDMLKEERGLPNSANPSNYGSGTQWQWCWTYRSPMCFYDNDNDGLIDSYN